MKRPTPLALAIAGKAKGGGQCRKGAREAPERNKMKYSVGGGGGATGYGWRQEFDRLEDFEGWLNSMRREYTAHITVWDASRKDFIFWKDVLTFTPSIDDLQRVDRDYRTKTKNKKGIA